MVPSKNRADSGLDFVFAPLLNNFTEASFKQELIGLVFFWFKGLDGEQEVFLALNLLG